MADTWTSPDGRITLMLGDCLSVLPTLAAGSVDAVVVDPPYGIGEAAGKNKSRSHLAISKDYGCHEWDNKPLSQYFINEVFRVSKWQIILGGNYYNLPPSSCWLVWDKMNGANDFADCELAWTNLKKAVRRIQYLWHGMFRANNESRGLHPTQKPLGVMEWCIKQLPPDVKTIGDFCMGSGTTGVAAINLGLNFIGCEIDPHYFEIARARIEQAIEDKANEMPLEFAEDAPESQGELFDE